MNKTITPQQKVEILQDIYRNFSLFNDKGLCILIVNQLREKYDRFDVELMFNMKLIKPYRPDLYWWSRNIYGNWRRKHALNKLIRYWKKQVQSN